MADIFDRILLLKNSGIFSEVKTENLLAVAQVLEEEYYVQGDRIFDIDDRGDRMYMLQKGKIGISTVKDIKSDNFIAELGEGECFGEMNLLDDMPRSATAHVLKDAQVLSLEKDKLRNLISKYPDLSMGIMKSLSIRLRNTTNLLNNS